jgi:hypothetical protein
MYQRLNYREDGNAYVRLKLSQSSSLWRLLAQIPIDRGQVISYLPPTASNAAIPFMEWHLHSREDLQNRKVDYEYRTKERDFLAGRLNKRPRGVGIFYGCTVAGGGRTRSIDEEDVTTAYHMITDAKGAIVMTEVYYVVGNSMTRERLDYLLDNVVERLPFLGVLTSVPPGMEFPQSKQMSKAFLEGLALYSEVITVGAYGGDANLIWTRT